MYYLFFQTFSLFVTISNARCDFHFSDKYECLLICYLATTFLFVHDTLYDIAENFKKIVLQQWLFSLFLI